MRIKEIEKISDENIREALQDYIESCHRTGHHDADKNVQYFMRENNIDNCEYDSLIELYMKLDD